MAWQQFFEKMLTYADLGSDGAWKNVLIIYDRNFLMNMYTIFSRSSKREKQKAGNVTECAILLVIVRNEVR